MKTLDFFTFAQNCRFPNNIKKLIFMHKLIVGIKYTNNYSKFEF